MNAFYFHDQHQQFCVCTYIHMPIFKKNTKVKLCLEAELPHKSQLFQ